MKKIVCLIVLIVGVHSFIDFDLDGFLKDNRIDPDWFRLFFGLERKGKKKEKSKDENFEYNVPDNIFEHTTSTTDLDVKQDTEYEF